MTTSALLPHNFVEKNRRDSSLAAREQYDFDQGEASATVVYEGPWSKRQDFINDYIAKDVFDVNGTLVSKKPAEYPHDPRLTASNATLVGKGKGIEDAQGITQYERAEITVTYSTKVYSTDDSEDDQTDYPKGKYIHEESDSKLEYLSIPGHSVAEYIPGGGGENQNENGPFGVPYITADLIITQEFVIRPRWLEINFLHGSLNDRAFITPAGRVAPKGTLRYDGLKASTKINLLDIGNTVNTTVIPRWKLTHRFSYNNRGWKKWHIGKNNQQMGFAELVNKNGQPLIPSADLFWIFFGFGVNSYSQALATIDFHSTTIRNVFDAHPDGNFPGGDIAIMQNAAFQINSTLQQLGFNV